MKRLLQLLLSSDRDDAGDDDGMKMLDEMEEDENESSEEPIMKEEGESQEAAVDDDDLFLNETESVASVADDDNLDSFDTLDILLQTRYSILLLTHESNGVVSKLQSVVKAEVEEEETEAKMVVELSLIFETMTGLEEEEAALKETNVRDKSKKSELVPRMTDTLRWMGESIVRLLFSVETDDDAVDEAQFDVKAVVVVVEVDDGVWSEQWFDTLLVVAAVIVAD